jgi:ABC-type multidrug transport system ATPase subunit
LRTRFGLAPSPQTLEAPRGLAYCGREFRIYPSMRIGEALRFYAALHERWDAARLEADLEAANLRPEFEVRRMKRAYQRALVLALATAAEPTMLVIENAEEFDEPATLRLLDRAVRRTPYALATYGPEAQADAALFDEILSPQAFEMEPAR